MSKQELELPKGWVSATFLEVAEDVVVGHVGKISDKYTIVKTLLLNSYVRNRYFRK